MNISEEVSRLLGECDDRQKIVKWLVAHQRQIESLEGVSVGSICGSMLDFDGLTHNQVISVIKAFGGNWVKERNGEDRIDYTADIDGMTVRCWRVEIEELVPEQVIPAHTVKKFKMVCKEPDEVPPVANTEAVAEPSAP
jgi:hypothetical protein